MRIYLDDDSVDHLLIKLLRADGHDVFVPPTAGQATVRDPVHFTAAILDRRACLTQNHRDFRELHDLILAAGGNHPGLPIIRKDNDPRDMRPHEIVASLASLVGSGISIEDGCHILNHYRRP